MGWRMVILGGGEGETGRAPVDFCFPATGAIQSTIEIAVKELPAAIFAYTTTSIRQSIYPGVLEAYDAIVSASQPPVMPSRMTRARPTSSSARPSSARWQALTTRASK